MADFSSWSLNLFPVRGVPIRLHAFFLFFGVLAIYLGTHGPDGGTLAVSLAALGVLFVSVLLHELGHALVAARLGGYMDQIVIGPLGGLVPPRIPLGPQVELFVASAGPATNLAICTLAAPILSLAGVNPLGLLSLTAPQDVVGGAGWLIAVKLAFWLNFLLLIVNLLPDCRFFDGGRIYRALLSLAVDYRTAAQVVGRSTQVLAIGMCVVAIMLADRTTPGPLPIWAPMALFAIFLFFSAKHELARLDGHDDEDSLLQFDFAHGEAALERRLQPVTRHEPGRLRRWLAMRRAARRRQQRLIEQDEERQVDAILARLHEHGMNAITPQERALLDRVSARYRSRERSS